MTILLTGGAGYIGSIVTEALLDAGYSVVVIDDLSSGKREAVDQRATFLEGDFSDEFLLDFVFSQHQIDSVIHLAASANVPESISNPALYYKNNTAKTLTLLEEMYKARVKNIIFSSTAAVYGEPRPLVLSLSEDEPTNPICPYGRSKLMAEQIIKDFARAYEMKYTIFRYLCVAGATEKHGESREKESHLIPLIIDQVLGSEKSFSVYGDNHDTPDGTGIRDYFHVKDVALAHLYALASPPDARNHIYNLGSGIPYSVLDVIAEAESLFGVMIRYDTKAPRQGDPARLVAHIEKARQLLGWVPSGNLKEILMSSYNWQKNKPY